MSFPWIPATALGLLVTLTPWSLTASELPEDHVQFFEKKIRPVLVQHCYECHSVEADKGKGGLFLDSRDGVIAGGDSGTALQTGNPDRSLLIEAIAYANPDLEMPPDKRLPPQVVEDFRYWVTIGAPDPRTSSAPIPRQTAIDYEAARDFWSFRPIQAPEPPEVNHPEKVASEIDRFILSRLEKEGLSPAEPASPGVLLRRICFDLGGLPPSPEMQAEFEADPSEERLVEIVDRLLNSREFGERWGRHWLDMVRYAESTGGGRSMLMKEAWRFRDYVIDSFNQDKPLNRLIREHIAGDLLPWETAAERRENLIGAGFLVLGPHNYEDQDKDKLRMDIVDEQIDTIGQAFMGMTVGCARCHDHMFDPISTEDYYALAAILRGTHSSEYANVNNWVQRPLPLDRELTPEEEQKMDAWKQELAKLREQFAAATRGEEKKGIGSKIIAQVKKGAPGHESAMSVLDAHDAGDYYVCVRGDVHNLGQPVKRGFLTIASSDPRPDIPEGESGRLQLAEWVVDGENPLTARVLANRVWQHLFGYGLVRTAANFGAMGEEPTHPELLDWLAVRLTESGWSTKALVREIVLSNTYRTSSRPEPDMLKKDPENLLLARQNLRRLEAEAVRDTMLHLAGALEPCEGGITFDPKLGSEFGYPFKERVRSVYLPVFRNSLEGLLVTFDFANPNLVSERRPVSTVPSQALYMMNSEFVTEQARIAAERLLKMEDEPEARVEQAFRQAFGRDPEPAELERSLAFLHTFPRERTSPEDELATWAAFQQALFSSIDFRYLP